MKVSIDDEACSINGISRPEAFILGAVALGSTEMYKRLAIDGYITRANSSINAIERHFTITKKGAELLNKVLMDSDKALVSITGEVQELAKELMSIYPSGKMPGTSYYYRGNLPDIERKLKSFIKKYGNIYTLDQIREATKAYVESFNGNYTYLKLLKYFIWKSEVKDGETVVTSVLADWIENKGHEDSLRSDWSATMV